LAYLVERWPDREAIWVMAGDRTRIGLWRPQVGLAGGRGGIHVHYAMHLPEAHYDAAVTRLRAHGVELEEHSFATYAQSRAAYADDPDGNVVELWTWDVANHLHESDHAAVLEADGKSEGKRREANRLRRGRRSR
jgi:glyoxalase/bleomycin resistance protein/dioxygenase superfamily protein